MPEIVYLANKSENGYEGDILSDFYRMFPHIAEPDQDGNVIEPIFISAEHGDGLPDLYQAIKSRIPQTHISYFQDKKKKRVERFNEYKQLLLDEFIESRYEEIKDLEE